MRTGWRVIVGTFVAVFVLAAGRAQADKLRRLVREGNRAFAQKDYEKALEKYRRAQVEAPESPHLYFDIANALMAQGKHDEAIENFRKVYSRRQPSLAAWAFYNIGVSQYRQAEQAIGVQDYQTAIKLLEQCMASNREAMKIDPGDEDPKYNFEQAKRKLKEVLDAMKKQQEEQKKQQEQQKQQNKQPKSDQQNKQGKEEQKKDDQKKKDQQKQNQQKQQNKKQGAQAGKKQKPTSGTRQQSQPPQRAGEMTPEDAQRILNALADQNAQDLKQFLMRQVPSGYSFDKDW